MTAVRKAEARKSVALTPPRAHNFYPCRDVFQRMRPFREVGAFVQLNQKETWEMNRIIRVLACVSIALALSLTAQIR